MRLGDRDPRVEELRHMGLGTVWVRVADAIGYEVFLTMWAVISASHEFMDGRNRTTIPDISLLYRYQRNQLVRALSRRGLNKRQIFNEVARLTGLALSDNQIEHIIRGVTHDADEEARGGVCASERPEASGG